MDLDAVGEKLLTALQTICANLHILAPSGCGGSKRKSSNKKKKSQKKLTRGCKLVELVRQSQGYSEQNYVTLQKLFETCCPAGNNSATTSDPNFKAWSAPFVKIIETKKTTMLPDGLLTCSSVIFQFSTLATGLASLGQRLSSEKSREGAVFAMAESIVRHSVSSCLQLAAVANADCVEELFDKIKCLVLSLELNMRSFGDKYSPEEEAPALPTAPHTLFYSDRYNTLRAKLKVASKPCVCDFQSLFCFKSKNDAFEFRPCDYCNNGSSSSSSSSMDRLEPRRASDTSGVACASNRVRDPGSSAVAAPETKTWQEILGVLPEDLEGSQGALLKCRKCGKTDCSYRLVATRSGDEGLTAFCYCRNCQYNWKMIM